MSVPGPGAVVTGMRPGVEPPTTFVGHVVSREAAAVAVCIAGPPDCTPGEYFVLVAGPRQAPATAVGRFAGLRGDHAVFLTPVGWRAFDQRAAHRYPLLQRAEVWLAAGERAHGVVLDISAGGIAVEIEGPMPAHAPPDAVDVMFSHGGYSATLGCSVMDAHGDAGHTVLHLKYHTLTPLQMAFVRHVISALAAEAASAA